MQDTDPIPQ
jgi:hypothetical protein